MVRLVGTDPVVTHAGRAKPWILVGGLLGLVAGVGWHASSAPYYRARTAIELSELPSTIDMQPGGGAARTVSVDTDAQIVTGDAVVEAVAEAVGRDVASARRSMAISARPLTRVMVVTYSGRTADEAMAGSGAAAEAFLAERERLLVAPVRDWLIQLAETQEQEAAVPVATAVSDTAEQARVFPRPVLDNRRRRAVEESLALPGPGRTLEGSSRAPSAERGQAELPLVSGAALGSLLGLAVGVTRVRRRETHQVLLVAAPGRGRTG